MLIRRRIPIEPVTALEKGPAELSLIANPGSNQYPACSVSSPLSSLIQIPEFSERPIIVPNEFLNGLSRLLAMCLWRNFLIVGL